MNKSVSNDRINSAATSTDEPAMRWYTVSPPWRLIDLGELWRYRELIWAYGIRDLKVRYRQAVIGILWAIIQPLFTVVVFGVLFSLLRGQATSGETAYGVTSLCGLVPWQFFSASVSQATLSIALNNQLLKKVYFPRVILPFSAFVPATVDFGVAFAMLGLVMVYYGVVPGVSILLLPLLVVMTIITAASFALWFAALNGIYRDVQFAVPFLLQLGMFVCPVVYETDAVIPERWRALYYLNPMAGLVQCYRSVLIGSPWPSWLSLLLSALMVVVIGVGGAAYFRRMERHFADLS